MYLVEHPFKIRGRECRAGEVVDLSDIPFSNLRAMVNLKWISETDDEPTAGTGDESTSETDSENAPTPKNRTRKKRR